MAEIKYQYAYDENGLLVSINDYNKETSKLHTFKCISCGNALLPRAIGSVHRKAHFYHKSIVECSGETYLHKLGKLLIKKKFDNSEKFVISYHAKYKCNNKDCKLRHIACSRDDSVTIDLKKYYDTCSEEVEYNNFVADLLLTNSKKPKLQPIFIELYVSHACEEDKLKSGIKIIEIPLSSEQELRDIEQREVIEELQEPLFPQKKKNGIKFISFKREFEVNIETELYRYIYCSDIVEHSYLTKIKCRDSKHKLIKDSQVELNIVNLHNITDLSYDAEECNDHALQWMSKNKFLKRCNLCKFYYRTQGEMYASCRLSKKYGTPKHPNMREAENCKSYHINEIYYWSNNSAYYIEEVTSTKDSKRCFRVIIAGSSSFDDYKLFKEKCDYYLSSKMKDYAIIILAGTSKNTINFIKKYSEERLLLVEYHKANWGQDGDNAYFKSNERMIEKANALIAFWDGRGTITHSLIQKAQMKGIRVVSIPYQS